MMKFKILLVVLISTLCLPSVFSQKLDCSEGKFYSIGVDFDVTEWEIDQDIITEIGIIYSSPDQGQGIAIGPDLINGSNENIIYLTSGAFTNQMMYAVESDGTVTSFSTPNKYWNITANYKDVYLMGTNGVTGSNNLISKWDGSEFTTVVELEDQTFKCADLAVDEEGNIWTMVGESITSVGHAIVYNPEGEILYESDEEFDFLIGYGAFFSNGKAYFAFGGGNGIFSSKMTSFFIENGELIKGEEIAFGLNTSFADLASCPSFPSSNTHEELLEIKIYPNPSAEYIIIESDENREFEIYNHFGQQLIADKTIGNMHKIDLSGFNAGMYFIKIDQKSLSFIKGYF